jgi:hypothetical protein
MSSRDNAAIHQLLALLEARYAIRVLWALRDGHPQTFRLLQDSVGGITPNTLNTRIKELREAGLLQHGDGYCVTPAAPTCSSACPTCPPSPPSGSAVQAKKKPPTPATPDARRLPSKATLPADAQQATLVGRAWVEGQGAVLVRVTPEAVFDLSGSRHHAAHLLELLDDPAAAVREFQGAAAGLGRRHPGQQRLRRARAALPWLLAPCDLQAIKAAGVTFVASMLERVIEEQARGNPAWPNRCARKWSP